VASVLSWLRNKALANTVLKIDVDAITGQSNLSLSFNENDATESKKAILNALNAVAALGRKVILSIDEFQKVAEIDDSGWLEATLRTSMQKSKNISHIFTGSRRGLLEDMFNNKKRPFYRSCNIMQFEQTPAGFSEWIVTRFARAAIKCAVDVADYIRTRVNNTPSYVQEVCFHLVSQGCITIDKRAVDSTLDAIAAQSSYSYEALLNSMTPVQIRALKMLVNEGRFSYSKDRLNRYEFKSASNIQGAIKSLCDKQILDRKPGGTSQEFEFDDPMFRIWLMKIYNA
jgi:AAA+ ATPase superfamily predicted ATPase